MNLLSHLCLTGVKVTLLFACSMPVLAAQDMETPSIEAERHQEKIELSEQTPPQVHLTEKTQKVKVVVRVYVDVDGRQLQKEVSQSSGYPKIDKEALARVSTWKFVPAGRSNLTEPMWHVVPITFTLKQQH